MKSIISFALLFFLSVYALASETSSVTNGKGAVVAFTKEDGFKLSSKAEANLNIKFLTLSSGKWNLPLQSLVKIKQSTGVYRKYDGWIMFVLVKVINKNSDSITIASEDLQPGDEVAISGVKFLRMTDSDLNSDTVDNCAH